MAEMSPIDVLRRYQEYETELTPLLLGLLTALVNAHMPVGQPPLAQAARIAVPPLSNTFISLVKDTALAATIQVPELFRQAQLITARTFEIFTMYLAAALIYWALASILAHFQARLEARVNRHEQDN